MLRIVILAVFVAVNPVMALRPRPCATHGDVLCPVPPQVPIPICIGVCPLSV